MTSCTNPPLFYLCVIGLWLLQTETTCHASTMTSHIQPLSVHITYHVAGLWLFHTKTTCHASTMTSHIQPLSVHITYHIAGLWLLQTKTTCHVSTMTSHIQPLFVHITYHIAGLWLLQTKVACHASEMTSHIQPLSVYITYPVQTKVVLAWCFPLQGWHQKPSSSTPTLSLSLSFTHLHATPPPPNKHTCKFYDQRAAGSIDNRPSSTQTPILQLPTPTTITPTQAPHQQVTWLPLLLVLISDAYTVVALSSLARIFGACLTVHSLPVLFFFLSGDQITHTNSTFYTRIGPQWLSEPTPTSLGQRCMHV